MIVCVARSKETPNGALGIPYPRAAYLPAKTNDVDVLNEAGAQGWELIAIMSNKIAYLRRPIDDPADAPAERPTRRRRQGVGRSPSSDGGPGRAAVASRIINHPDGPAVAPPRANRRRRGGLIGRRRRP
jgi:hypothetical protein